MRTTIEQTIISVSLSLLALITYSFFNNSSPTVPLLSRLFEWLRSPLGLAFGLTLPNFAVILIESRHLFESEEES